VSSILVILLCGAIIALAVYLFIRNIINMSKGKCCEGCEGCPQKKACTNCSPQVNEENEKRQ